MTIQPEHLPDTPNYFPIAPGGETDALEHWPFAGKTFIIPALRGLTLACVKGLL